MTKLRRRPLALLLLIVLVAVILWFVLAPGVASDAGGGRSSPPVDRVLVVKSERKLHLMHDGQVLKTYRISLGGQPVGAKVREGDQRTPEGVYHIDWRHHSPRVNLSMHVSYPDAQDIARAHRDGVDPGGMIMIHGTPLNSNIPDGFFRWFDWTDGCIALTNADMREVWDRVPNHTPVEIRP